MKLASLANGTRDGQLLIVSRDLSRAVAIPHDREIVHIIQRGFTGPGK